VASECESFQFNSALEEMEPINAIGRCLHQKGHESSGIVEENRLVLIISRPIKGRLEPGKALFQVAPKCGLAMIIY